ncbi:MAG: flagellar assembly protein FliW [Vulcanimicrobiota bacterium]
MQLDSLRFGQLEVPESSLIEFTRPLVGLEESRRFVLLEMPKYRPFVWLQSVDQADLALALADPFTFFSDYEPDLDSAFLQALRVERGDELAIYCVVTCDQDGWTMNLAAPVVLHQRTRTGGQVVLDDTRFGTCHSLSRRPVACS